MLMKILASVHTEPIPQPLFFILKNNNWLTFKKERRGRQALRFCNNDLLMGIWGKRRENPVWSPSFMRQLNCTKDYWKNFKFSVKWVPHLLRVINLCLKSKVIWVMGGVNWPLNITSLCKCVCVFVCACVCICVCYNFFMYKNGYLVSYSQAASLFKLDPEISAIIWKWFILLHRIEKKKSILEANQYTLFWHTIS